jgi:hypothetical protein
MSETKPLYRLSTVTGTESAPVRIAPPARIGDPAPTSAINYAAPQITQYDAAAEALAVCAALLPERLTDLAYIEAVKLEMALHARIVAFEAERLLG